MTKPISKPRPSAEDYAAAARLHEANTLALIRNADINPNWLGDTGRFWYQKQIAGGSQFVLVDAATGRSQPAFDHAAVAAALNAALQPETPSSAENLGLQNLRLSPDGLSLTGSSKNRRVTLSLEDRSVTTVDLKPQEAGLLVSPTGRHGVTRDGDNLVLVEIATGHRHRLTQDG